MDFADFKQQLGPRLQNFRRRRNLTQEELADKSQLSIETISSIERGKNIPRVETLFQIGEILGVSLSDLFDIPASKAVSRDNQEEMNRLFRLLEPQRRDVIKAVVAQAEIIIKLDSTRSEK